MLSNKRLNEIRKQLDQIQEKDGGAINTVNRKILVRTKGKPMPHLRDCRCVTLERAESLGGLSVELVAVFLDISPIVSFENDEFMTFVGKVSLGSYTAAIVELRYPF